MLYLRLDKLILTQGINTDGLMTALEILIDGSEVS